VFDEIIKRNAYPTPIGFMRFPKSVCVSVNECIVHGIATERPLERGDKINIDVTVFYDGYHGDNNLTVFYGESEHEPVRRIAQLAQEALYKAISICKPGTPFNNIGKLLE
jgi:methionyl aminopeptidase